jgi:DNA-directed RNA polymerase subunit RPC12/RpoP
MVTETNHHCVSCGSKNLCYGYTGNTSNVFVPSGIFTISGFRTRAYVCLDCGHISEFLTLDKVEKLKARLRDRL